MRCVRLPVRILLACALLFSVSVLARDFRFNGSMSEEVLRNYLSRSMTTMYLLTGHGDFDDNLRLLTNCGVKFAGRAVYQWGREEGGASALPKKLELARANAEKIHRADPELILQACVFEIVSSDPEFLEAQWEVLLATTLDQSTSLIVQPREGAPMDMQVRLEKTQGKKCRSRRGRLRAAVRGGSFRSRNHRRS